MELPRKGQRSVLLTNNKKPVGGDSEETTLFAVDVWGSTGHAGDTLHSLLPQTSTCSFLASSFPPLPSQGSAFGLLTGCSSHWANEPRGYGAPPSSCLAKGTSKELDGHGVKGLFHQHGRPLVEGDPGLALGGSEAIVLGVRFSFKEVLGSLSGLTETHRAGRVGAKKTNEKRR